MNIEFDKILNKIAYRHNINNVFVDFVEMAVCAFTIGKMEERYKEIVKRYNEEEIKLFGEALGALLLDYDKCSQDGEWNDILGDYYMEISSGKQASKSGQFFTPSSICDLMAKVTEQETDDNITVNDCACGSSRNLIAHSRLNPNNRFKTFYVGNDLDKMCVNMSVINFIMYGLRGVVIHMDTLKNEPYSGFRIYLPETGMFVQPLNSDECRQFF